MSIVVLMIGTILSLLFVLFLFLGQKYDYMLDGLDSGDFPLAFLYGPGLVLQEYKIGRIPDRLGAKLRESTRLIYSRKYSEYYARVIWAQGISLGWLFSSVCFLLAGVFADMAGMMCFAGIFMAVFPGYYFINHMVEQVSERQYLCDKQFPDAISKLALLVNSGAILHEAWRMVAYGNEGELYTFMQIACEAMENGKSDAEAIYDFGVTTNSDNIKKFASALVQSIERGGSELPVFLSNQSKELWAHHRQAMLQKGEMAAGALLIPVALMFAGVMLIIVAAAMLGISL